MRILLLGATGMVGYGVLRECLLADDVDEVVVVGRTSLGRRHPKLTELIVPDVGNLDRIADQIIGIDGCLFCLGVSSVGMSEAQYRPVTYDLTLSVAERLATSDPGSVFIYVSGAGTDANGRQMWARVKGETENALLALPLRTYLFRPGIIEAKFGARTKTPVYNALYAVLGWIIPTMRRISAGGATATDTVGRAMLTVVRTRPEERVVTTRLINELGAG